MSRRLVKCQICHHEWFTRKAHPQRCANLKCQSIFWNDRQAWEQCQAGRIPWRKPRKCEGCEVIFTPTHRKQRFHSDACGGRYTARRRREETNVVLHGHDTELV